MIKQGYKPTEIGVIPEDWEVKTIGESFSFKNGLNKEKQYFGYGFPIVNYMDVFKNTFITSQTIKGKVFVNKQELKNFNVNKGDVLFTRTSETQEEIGYSAVIIEELEDTVFSGFVLRGRPFNNLFSIQYCRYAFSNKIVREQIISNASFTTRALTNGRVLSEVKIPFPPLAEQEAIASALSDADAWIESLEQLIAKKRLIKQGAMQTLLTPPSEELVLSGVEPWEVKKLREVGVIITGGTPSTTNKEFWGGDIPWITPTDISINKNIHIGERSITKNGLQQVRALPADTLLVTCIASIGKNSILRKRGACNQQINAVIPNAGYNVEFLYYLLELNKSVLQGKAGVTATPILSKAEFSTIEFQFPSLSEQERIATILSDMDSELEALEAQLGKARQIKQGMMQELLTGRTRLV